MRGALTPTVFFLLPFHFKPMNHKPLFLATALIVLLALAGAFWCLQNRPGAMDQPVVTEPVAQAPIQAETEKYPQHIEVIPGNTDEVWYNIPELGIRMKLNKEFAEDLVYVYDRRKDDEGEVWDEIGFSTKALAAITDYCSPGAIGAIDRITTVLKEEIKDNTTRHLNDYIRVGDYFYGFESGHDPCWDPSLESEVRKVFPGKYAGAGAKYVSDGLKTIELIPQK